MINELYYKDAYLCEHDTIVTQCLKNEKGEYEIFFEETCFFPEGGGHPFDQGHAGNAFISAVFNKNGDIVHISDQPLTEGESVHLSTDPARRIAAMRVHSAEHIVSGLILKKLGYKNVGFHIFPPLCVRPWAVLFTV